MWHWAIIEEQYFELAASKIFGSAQRADVALDATKWSICRETNNFAGYPVVAMTPLGPLHAFRSANVPAFPSIVVYFTVNVATHTVTLHDIC